MFTSTLCGGYQSLLPGLHNLALSGRGGPVRGQTRTASVWQEAVRRLELLTPKEVQILSSQSAQVLSGLTGEVVDCTSQTWQEDFSKALTTLSSVSGSRLPKSLLKNRQAPLLQTARGFKSRARSETPSSPFQKNKSEDTKVDDINASDSEALKDVLKNLNISPSEREKVQVALLSYAAGKSKSTSQTTSSEEKSKRPQWFSGTKWEYLSRLANLVFILFVIVVLAQQFNFPFPSMRGVMRGGNEIAPEEIDVTFDDVKGCDEAKQELQEVVEFLMNPEKFSALGGKLPKGCLLSGPPGTGKTLLARAVAGQAGVPFFHASGSEFDEVLVGQGARRVRDLFKAAKEKAPCVIFIDEIDSVGGKRSSSVLHPYANQTINQLLSEMDGFLSNEGVIVLGATNRSEDLDKALLRPGRFDTEVIVGKPDIKGRREILSLYLSKIKHDDSIDLESLASRTTGFSGADLQNLVNTAAIRAAVEGKNWVSMAEFELAYDKHVMGTEWKSRVRDKEDLKITAYHEAGHTLVAYFTKESMPLHKVTIIAKGQSGGHTAFTPPPNAEWHETKAQMKASMDVAMGGRAAEELMFGKEKITGGASADLQNATRVSEQMVKYLGMSEKMGLRVMDDKKEPSPSTKEVVDEEVNRLLNESYKRAVKILTDHRKELVLLAEALLKYETLDAEDIKAIVEHKKPPTPKIPAGSLLAGLTGSPALPVGLSAMGSQQIDPETRSTPGPMAS